MHDEYKGNFINCNFVVVLGLNRESTSSWQCGCIGQPKRPHSAREIYKLPINLPLRKLNGDCSLCTGHVSHLIRHRRGSRLYEQTKVNRTSLSRGLCNCAMNARCWATFGFSWFQLSTECESRIIAGFDFRSGVFRARTQPKEENFSSKAALIFQIPSFASNAINHFKLFRLLSSAKSISNLRYDLIAARHGLQIPRPAPVHRIDSDCQINHRPELHSPVITLALRTPHGLNLRATTCNWVPVPPWLVIPTTVFSGTGEGRGCNQARFMDSLELGGCQHPYASPCIQYRHHTHLEIAVVGHYYRRFPFWVFLLLAAGDVRGMDFTLGSDCGRNVSRESTFHFWFQHDTLDCRIIWRTRELHQWVIE